jgi:hypothetical protein
VSKGSRTFTKMREACMFMVLTVDMIEIEHTRSSSRGYSYQLKQDWASIIREFINSFERMTDLYQKHSIFEYKA